MPRGICLSVYIFNNKFERFVWSFQIIDTIIAELVKGSGASWKIKFFHQFLKPVLSNRK